MFLKAMILGIIATLPFWTHADPKSIPPVLCTGSGSYKKLWNGKEYRIKCADGQYYMTNAKQKISAVKVTVTVKDADDSLPEDIILRPPPEGIKTIGDLTDDFWQKPSTKKALQAAIGKRELTGSLYMLAFETAGPITMKKTEAPVASSGGGGWGGGAKVPPPPPIDEGVGDAAQ